MRSPLLHPLSLIATLLLAAPTVQAQTSLTVVDRSSDWFESRAWGGGATIRLNMPQRRAPGAPSLDFLGGAAPQFILGCSSRDPRNSHWRFVAGFSPPGTAINNVPGAEQAYEQGTARLLGAAGVLILLDEMDDEMIRLPIAPGPEGLRTGPLDAAMMERFRNASAIRVETPRLSLEASTNLLPAAFGDPARLPCRAG